LCAHLEPGYYEYPPPPRAKWGFIFSVITGFLVLFNTFVIWIAMYSPDFLNRLRLVFAYYGALAIFDAWSLLIVLWAIVGVIISILIFLGAILIYLGNGALGGVVVFIFSVLSLVIWGGFIVGILLGIIGGLLGILEK